MPARNLILFIVSFTTLLFAESSHPNEHADVKTAKPRTPTHAVAKVTVQSSDSKPYDQSVGPALMEINITETFTGDIDGDSTVRALQLHRDDQTASFVSMQRFRGKLAGRLGTFVMRKPGQFLAVLVDR